MIQARLPGRLDARYETAGWTGWGRPPDSNSRFQSRPNYVPPFGLLTLLRKLGLVLAALLFAASGAAQGATINARSSSLADVSSAIIAARDGDIVIIPAGTASWTSTLVIAKGITLQGQTTTNPVAGTAVDKTIIQDNVPRGAAGTPLIKVQSVLGQSYRISGITFSLTRG